MDPAASGGAGGGREIDVHPGAAAGLALDRDPAAMLGDDAVDDREVAPGRALRPS